MFDIGFWELAVIGLIALIVLGPSRLPEAARTAGRWAGRLRTFIDNVKRDLDKQLQADELAELRRLKSELVKTRSALQQSSNSILDTMSGVADSVTTGSAVEAVEQAVASDAVAADSIKTDSANRRKKKKKSAAKKTTSKKSAKKSAKKSVNKRKKSSHVGSAR